MLAELISLVPSGNNPHLDIPLPQTSAEGRSDCQWVTAPTSAFRSSPWKHQTTPAWQKPNRARSKLQPWFYNSTKNTAKRQAAHITGHVCPASLLRGFSTWPTYFAASYLTNAVLQTWLLVYLPPSQGSDTPLLGTVKTIRAKQQPEHRRVAIPQLHPATSPCFNHIHSFFHFPKRSLSPVYETDPLDSLLCPSQGGKEAVIMQSSTLPVSPETRQQSPSSLQDTSICVLSTCPERLEEAPCESRQLPPQTSSFNP